MYRTAVGSTATTRKGFDLHAATDAAAAAASDAATTTYQPVFDFSCAETVDKIERLDDAIMGGISTSAVRASDGFARWSGVCRTDGGYVYLLFC
jgi:Complex I intermediate-associated protein 30 (CIA30)